MALRDTIEGAVKEAEESGISFPRSNKKAESKTSSKGGARKKSAATAKPSREAASSVRASSGSKVQSNAGSLTKEERKEARRQEREKQDMRAQATQVLLDEEPGYKKSERVWWWVIVLGFLLTLAALTIYYAFPEEGQNFSTTLGKLGIGSLAAAYACIVVAFIYDFRKRRPVRKAVEAKVEGMTDKKVIQILQKESKRRAEEREAKEAQKRAKKQG